MIRYIDCGDEGFALLDTAPGDFVAVAGQRVWPSLADLAHDLGACNDPKWGKRLMGVAVGGRPNDTSLSAEDDE